MIGEVEYTYQDKQSKRLLKGFITIITEKQLASDELQMSVEMMKAGYFLTEKKVIISRPPVEKGKE